MLRLPSSQDLSALGPRFAPFILHNELHIAGRTLRFPNIVTGAKHEPVEWLLRTHEAAPVHEPGLVAWLFNLGEAMGSEPVAFFDIGAAYGYFSLLASLAFARVQVFAVEPNPALTDYVEKLARHNRVANIRVINRLVGDRSADLKLKNRNFVFLPEGLLGPDNFTDVDITMMTLDRLLADAGASRPIVKIDVEGWQARILPPALDQLVKCRSVILLECDNPEKMARFGATNAQLADLFLKRGYRLFLTDHRERAVETREVLSRNEVGECDALLTMIPPDLPTSA